MKLKKLLSVATSVLVATTVLTGCSSNSKKEEKKVSIGIVLGEGSVNDQSFNQSTWEGLQKAKKELGVDVKYLESKQESDYLQHIETLIDQNTDLIIGVGYQLKDSIANAAKNYPDKKFAIMDETYDEIPKNVVPVTFKEEEAAYLTGIIAAKMSKTNTVGFIGGLPAPSVVKYQYGFKYGVATTNKDAKILEQFANTFTDQAKGKSIAKQMFGSNADIILAAAGDTGVGSIEAAKENNKYAIGVDRDQNYLAEQNVITSALKKLNVASYDLAKNLVNNKFEGGKGKVYGIKEGGVDLSENTSKHVPKEVLDFVEAQKEKILKGEITVPKTKEEYNKSVK